MHMVLYIRELSFFNWEGGRRGLLLWVGPEFLGLAKAREQFFR